MAKARALEAEISRIIAVNRANCDHLLHALIKLGFRDDDVEPLRGDIGHAELGKGYVRFMLSAEDLVSCEPKLSSSKVAPIMLEIWNGIYDMESLHIQRARRRRKNEQEKDDKSEAYTEALKEEEEAIKMFAKVNIEFSRYRALNHVFMGTYKPKPKAEAFLDEGLKVIEACKEGNLEQLELLMHNGKYNANEFEVHSGATPLHWACWNKHIECVDLLLQHKANVNAKTLRGFTPLHFAYQQHTDEIIKHLIDGKADVTAKSALGQAPGSKGAGLGSELEILKPFYGETTKGKKSSIPP